MKNQQSIKAVLKPSAQITTVCAVNEQLYDKVSTFMASIMIDSLCQPNELIVFELMLRYGCRVSECLNLCRADITNTGLCKIKGLKGSSDRVLQLIDTILLVNNSFFGNFPISYTTNRFRIYRLCKQFGINGIYGNNLKRSVTHFGRHRFVLDLINIGVDERNISQLIGHKNTNNIKYYACKEKNK